MHNLTINYIIYVHLINVMQSDGDSFCGDVFLDSVNMAWIGQDFKPNKWKANIFGSLISRIKFFEVIKENAYLKYKSPLQQVTHKIRFEC